MANYYGICRTNYFHVTDEDAYQRLFSNLSADSEIEDFSKQDENGQIYHAFGCEDSIEYHAPLSSLESVIQAVKEGKKLYDQDDNEISYHQLDSSACPIYALYTAKFCHPLDHEEVKRAIADGKTLYKEKIDLDTVFNSHRKAVEVTVEELESIDNNRRDSYPRLFTDKKLQNCIYHPQHDRICDDSDIFEDRFDDFLYGIQKILPEGEAFVFQEVGSVKLVSLLGYYAIVTRDTIETNRMNSQIEKRTKELLGDNYILKIEA